MNLAQLLEGILGTSEFQTRSIFDVNPVSGNRRQRTIYMPNKAMRDVHDHLMSWIRGLRVSLPHATGGRTGNSPLANIRRHAGKRFFVLYDLHAAFESVDGKRLAKLLAEVEPDLARQEEGIYEFLRHYCLTPEGGLCTGAPASPDLFNLYTGLLLDRELAPLCARWSITYTRYIDDCTFSSREVIGNRKRAQLRAIMTAAGFTLNHNKTRVADLQKGPVVICGIGLTYGGHYFLPRSYLRLLRGLIHRAQTVRDVPPSVVHGHMGVFWSTRPKHQPLNGTEKKLVFAYRDYQRSLSR